MSVPAPAVPALPVSARAQHRQRGGSTQVSAAVFDGLVNRIYEAALGEFAWEDLCAAIARALDWLHVRLLHEDPSAREASSPEERRLETFVAGEAFVAAHGMPHDAMASLGPLTIARVPLEDDAGSILEGLANGDPAAGLETIARLRPHLARALELHRERESRVERHRIAAWLLDAVPQAIAVVSADGTIVPGNGAWKVMFPGSDTLTQLAGLIGRGEGGWSGNGELAASMRELFAPVPVSDFASGSSTTRSPTPAGTAQADRPARAAHATRRRVWRIGRPGGAHERLIIATALPASAPGGEGESATAGGLDAEARVLLIVHSPGAPDRIDPGMLADTFDLTRAETTVTQRLARGEQAQDIADARYVSRQTIRSQMRMIYRKLGVRRQADLVRIIAQLPRIENAAPLRTSALREATRMSESESRPVPVSESDPDPDPNIQQGAES